MHVLVLRWVLTIYVIGFAWVFYHAVSVFLFQKEVTWKFKFKRFFKMIFFGITWPLSLFSMDGRKTLRGNFDRL